MRKSCWRRRRE